MNLWEVVGLVVALSLDGFFVGLSFGLRKIRVPRRSLLVLAACSGLGLALSMTAAGLLVRSWPAGSGLSGWILLIVGLWRLLEGWAAAHAGQEAPLLAFSVPQAGLLVHVLVDPAQADRDRSGRIDPGEAVALGIALSLDALAVGLAVAPGRGTALLPLWVGAGLYLLTRGGLSLAGRMGPGWARGKKRLLPGLILVVLGLAHLGRAGP